MRLSLKQSHRAACAMRGATGRPVTNEFMLRCSQGKRVQAAHSSVMKPSPQHMAALVPAWPLPSMRNRASAFTCAAAQPAWSTSGTRKGPGLQLLSRCQSSALPCVNRSSWRFLGLSPAAMQAHAVLSEAAALCW